MNGPTDLGGKAGMTLFQSEAYLAAAIVYAETAKLAPDDPSLLLGLGAAVGNSAGVLVVAPFVEWSTRALKRCLAVGPTGPYADVAKQRLEQLRQKKEFRDVPALEPADLDELLAFLDIDPSIVVQGIGKVPADDQMFLVMALGDLQAPRFAPVIAAAISGTWGAGAARAALKRMGPYAKRRIVRDAMVALRASPVGAECDPYLSFAEQRLPAEIEEEPPQRAPGLAAPDQATEKKPWWKLW